MNLRYVLLGGLFLLSQLAAGQKMVSIIIDDVPNTSRYEADGYRSILLRRLDSLRIPIAIFINEGLIYKTDSVAKNLRLLNDWSRREYVTLGNHSFSHSRYSATGIDSFKIDILRGESVSRELSGKYNKTLRYFRFPFNDLGQDSLQHAQIRQFLKENDYQIAPFTIESSDWMYNYVYEYYLKNGKFDRAKEIGREYVTKTLAYFDFFDAVAVNDYGRPIRQIYLCHDNKLNADFLPVLVNELRKREYKLISLEEALTDAVYSQSDHYFLKWGISWFYRWKTTQKERAEMMKNEPSIENILQRYERILEENKVPE